MLVESTTVCFGVCEVLTVLEVFFEHEYIVCMLLADCNREYKCLYFQILANQVEIDEYRRK